MLPGFRFLIAAIVLSMSVLVFGLGAAALLRTAHEEFASNPSWRAAPEAKFAQPAEATGPVLAMLRVDMPVVEKAQVDVAASTEPAAITSLPAESEPVAALKPEESSPPETVKVEIAKAEIPVAEGAAPGEAAPVPAEMPASPDETRIATIATDEKSPENQVVSAPSEPIAAPVSPGADIAATKIATLGGPPVNIETPPTKVSHAKPDPSAMKNRQQATRAARHRRIAARARVAAQAALQPVNPFGEPARTTRSR
jgi:hypothetical protein